MTPKKPIRVADNWCSFFRGQPAKNKIGSVDKTSEIGTVLQDSQFAALKEREKCCKFS